MKKYLSISAVILIIFAFIANVSNNLSGNVSPDIFIENLEALASGESGGQPMDCYSNIEKVDDGRPVETITYCGDCQSIRGTHWWNQSRCMR